MAEIIERYTSSAHSLKVSVNSGGRKHRLQFEHGVLAFREGEEQLLEDFKTTIAGMAPAARSRIRWSDPEAAHKIARQHAASQQAPAAKQGGMGSNDHMEKIAQVQVQQQLPGAPENPLDLPGAQPVDAETEKLQSMTADVHSPGSSQPTPDPAAVVKQAVADEAPAAAPAFQPRLN